MKKFNLQNILFIGLIILEFILLIISNFSNSMTFDEIIYAPAGLSYLEKRDFRLNIEHPPLSKYLLALPLFFSGKKGNYESKWWAMPNQIKFGKDFYFDRKNIDTLNISRFVSILGTVLFSIFLYFFVLKILGKREAIFSLVFFIFSPDVIAHGSLATTDLLFALFFFISVSFFYLFLKDFSLKNLIFTIVFTILTILTRHSGLFLFPFYFFFLIVYFIKKRLSFIKVLKFFILILIVSYLSIWVFYFFEKDVLVGKELKKSSILPASYINGIIISKDLINKRLCFFLGEVHTTPPKTFYLLSFILKTPILVLILISLSFFLKIFKKIWFFWISFLLFFTLSIFFTPNLSHRYLLFLYPFLFLISSSSAVELLKKKWDRIFLIFLLTFNIFSFFRFFPFCISYVNEFIKKEKIPFYFADSNVDWGQGLIDLKKYCEKEKIERIYLSYFGTASPDNYGIDFIPLPSYHQELYWEEIYPREILIKKGEKIGISITNLSGLYQPFYFGGLIDLEKIEKIVGGSIYIYTLKKDAKFEFQENSSIRWIKNKDFVLK